MLVHPHTSIFTHISAGLCTQFTPHGWGCYRGGKPAYLAPETLRQVSVRMRSNWLKYVHERVGTTERPGVSTRMNLYT